MRVYEEEWSQGVNSRLVRCDPTTDMLVITRINQAQLVFPYETMPGPDHFYENGLKTQKEWYPNDAKLFAEFRDLISSWENVAYYYSGVPPLVTDPPRYHDSTESWSNAHLIEGDPWDFEPFENDNPRPSSTLPSNIMFLAFVPYLQSLKRLVAWPHPKYWPELRKDAIVIDDVKDISFAKGTAMPRYVNVLVEDASSFLKYYSRDAKIHNALFMDSDEHWAVKAEPITRVGSFVAPSWIASFGDIEGPVGNHLNEEQSEKDEDGDGDEGSEDYSEEEEDEEEDDYSDTDGEVEGPDEDFSEEEQE